MAVCVYTGVKGVAVGVSVQVGGFTLGDTSSVMGGSVL